MRLTITLAVSILLTVLSFSCSDEEIMLYHPKEDPTYYWLLEKVDYPQKSEAGLINRKSFSFQYTDDEIIKGIDKLDPEYMPVTYRKDWAIYSIERKYSNYDMHDSIYVKLDANKRALYALHIYYYDYNDGSPVRKGVTDSTAYKYDAAGYLIEQSRYSQSTSIYPTYSETRRIENGNITEVITPGYKYTYTYDDTAYYPGAEYCREMPDNTYSLYTGGCLTLKNDIFYTQYLGKKSKNNAIRVTISQNDEKIPRMHGYVVSDISYAYTLNKDGLLSEVKMTQNSDREEIPADNNITTFSYIKKENKPSYLQ